MGAQVTGFQPWYGLGPGLEVVGVLCWQGEPGLGDRPGGKGLGPPLPAPQTLTGLPAGPLAALYPPTPSPRSPVYPPTPTPPRPPLPHPPGSCKSYPEVLHSRYVQRTGEVCGEIFLFEFGAAVLWDLSPQQERSILQVWRNLGGWESACVCVGWAMLVRVEWASGRPGQPFAVSHSMARLFLHCTPIPPPHPHTHAFLVQDTLKRFEERPLASYRVEEGEAGMGCVHVAWRWGVAVGSGQGCTFSACCVVGATGGKRAC